MGPEGAVMFHPSKSMRAVRDLKKRLRQRIKRAIIDQDGLLKWVLADLLLAILVPLAIVVFIATGFILYNSYEGALKLIHLLV
jgi:ABC-type antimicrobial peptide transport system ATPase subunit